MGELPDSQISTTRIIRRVGGFTAACLLVGNVIGSGIFTTTGFMARDLGNAKMILVVWLIGALLALAGAISYSELGAAMPAIGGEYVYLRHAYGPLIGFLSGWASFTVGFGAAIAAAAVSFTSYLLLIYPMDSERSPIALALALALVWILTAFHLAGVGPGGFLQRLLTVLKVTAILLLIMGGLSLGTGTWENLRVEQAGVSPRIGSIFVALIFVTYAYSGWNVAGYIAGELINPGRTIPRVMISGTLLVGFVYIGVNMMYFYALPVTALAEPPVLPVAQKASVAMFGPGGARLIAGLLCLSIAGAISAMVWAGPRVYYAMARDGMIPAVFAHTGQESGAPGKSIILQSTWASVLILLGTFEQLVVYSGIVLVAFSALAVGSVILLRRQLPDLPRPYKVPFYPLVPLLYIVVSVLMVGYTILERPVESLLAIATVLTGVPLYFLWRKVGGMSKQSWV